MKNESIIKTFSIEELILLAYQKGCKIGLAWKWYSSDEQPEARNIFENANIDITDANSLSALKEELSNQIVPKIDFHHLLELDLSMLCTLKVALSKLIHNLLAQPPTSFLSISNDKKVEITKIKFLINITFAGQIAEKTALLNSSHDRIKEVYTIYFNEFNFIEKNRSETFDKWLIDYDSKHSDSWGRYTSVEELVDHWIFTIGNGKFPQTNFGDKFRYKISKIKQAWSQKKHRDSNNGKKACSFMLGEEHIELLEKLCKKNRRKKNEMIEILIEDACEEDGLIKKPNRR